ncbi:hypothetical protein C4578_04105 [Candidatus Microgenomates bacterium]|nr:MAG: hypothetical protein C4578_04105 [Candidatus Microgenomates bacterium]
MKLEVPFSRRIELYELSDYAAARKWTDSLIAEREEVIEDLYEDCAPVMTSFDYDTGLCGVARISVEDMALTIIERKESYAKLIANEERKAKLFELAMESLTERERDVIQVQYHGRPNNLGLSVGYFNQLLREAQDKLCISLYREQEIRQVVNEEERREKLRKEIREFREGRL